MPPKKLTQGQRIAQSIYPKYTPDSPGVVRLAKHLDTAFRNVRRRAAWEAYSMAFNGVLPAGIAAIYGKEPPRRS